MLSNIAHSQSHAQEASNAVALQKDVLSDASLLACIHSLNSLNALLKCQINL